MMTDFFDATSVRLKGVATMMAATSLAALVGCDNAQSSTVSKTQTKEWPTATRTVPAANDQQLQQTLSSNLAKSGINAKILSVTATTMPNIYWVKAEGLPTFFTDSSGQYILQGDLVKVGGAQPEHVSANLMAQDAKNSLASIDKKDMIIFPAKGTTKAAIYVFTDTDCGYCRKLHSEIDQINSFGIEVRYLPWPRAEETLPIMEKVWCSSDRKAAMTQAKQGVPINAPTCDNPVKKLYRLGLSLGITGTPAIFNEEGHQLGGYLPAPELAKALNIQ